VPHADPDEARRRLHDILSRAEFSQARADPLVIVRLLRDLFEWLGGLSETAPVLFWVMVVSLVGVLVLLLAHITWTVRRALDLRAAGGDAAAAEQRALLSRTYEQEARSRADRGERTEAVRFLFLALIYRFDEQGRVPLRQALTNREYLAAFADRPAVVHDLTVFVDTLDDNWYGQRPTDAGQYQRCLALYESLVRRG
jgi:hypothetical protein